MGIRKYLSKTIIQHQKYQQVWKIYVNIVKHHNSIDLYDLSPPDVSFLRKKTSDYQFFL